MFRPLRRGRGFWGAFDHQITVEPHEQDVSGRQLYRLLQLVARGVGDGCGKLGAGAVRRRVGGRERDRQDLKSGLDGDLLVEDQGPVAARASRFENLVDQCLAVEADVQAVGDGVTVAGTGLTHVGWQGVELLGRAIAADLDAGLGGAQRQAQVRFFRDRAKRDLAEDGDGAEQQRGEHDAAQRPKKPKPGGLASLAQPLLSR